MSHSAEQSGRIKTPKTKGKLSPEERAFRLWILLTQVEHAIWQVRGEELSGKGLTIERAAVLDVVKELGDRATSARISRWLFRKRHSTKSLLDRMEKLDLVTKNKDTGNKKTIRIGLTEKGVQASHISADRGAIAEILGVLSVEEREQLKVLLKKLREESFQRLGTDQRTFLK